LVAFPARTAVTQLDRRDRNRSAPTISFSESSPTRRSHRRWQVSLARRALSLVLCSSFPCPGCQVSASVRTSITPSRAHHGNVQAHKFQLLKVYSPSF